MRAMMILALMLGMLVLPVFPQDAGIPRDLLERAEQGDAEAQFRLGNYYASEWRGVPQDYKKAGRWLRAAGEQGNVLTQFAGHCGCGVFAY